MKGAVRRVPLAAGTSQRRFPLEPHCPGRCRGLSRLLSQEWLVTFLTAGLGTLHGQQQGQSVLCSTRRWTSVCCKLSSHCIPSPSSLLLCSQPVFLLLAHLQCSLVVECRGVGTDSQVTQIRLEIRVSSVKMTLVPLGGHNSFISSSAVTTHVSDCVFPRPLLASNSCLSDASSAI